MNLLILVLLIFGVLSGAVLMIMPVAALWVLLIMSMLVTGSVGYFVPTLARLHWVLVPISLALLLRSLLAWLKERKEGEKMPLFVTAIVLLLVSVTISTLINRQFIETLIDSKNLFQFVSIPIAFYFLVRTEEAADAIMKALLVIAVLQLPMALVERVVSPGLDTITGTFGGSYVLGGGPNSSLAIFLTAMTGLVLALALNKAISWPRAVLLCFCFAIPVYMTNARAIIAFYLIMLFILFGKYFFRRPLASLLATVLIGIMLASTMYLHYLLGWSPTSRHHRVRNFSSYLERSVQSQLGLRTKAEQMNRTQAVVFWWEENTTRYGKVQMIFGHGLGSSKLYGIVQGHLLKNREYSLKYIGRTMLARMLWDLGLVGTFAYFMIFITAFFSARKLGKDPRLTPERKAYMVGSQISCLFFIVSIPYNPNLITNPALGAFSMFILGNIAFWHRRLWVAAPEKLQEPGLVEGEVLSGEGAA